MGSYGRSTGIEDLVEISRKHGYIPLHSIASNAAPALSPESTFFIEYCTGGPSSTTPVLLELSCLLGTPVPLELCVMGLDAQEAGGSLVHMEGAQVSKT